MDAVESADTIVKACRASDDVPSLVAEADVIVDHHGVVAFNLRNSYRAIGMAFHICKDSQDQLEVASHAQQSTHPLLLCQ